MSPRSAVPPSPALTTGRPSPLGVTLSDNGDEWNVAVWSRHALGMSVLLFERRDPARPCLTVTLDPAVHRSGEVWHVAIARSAAPNAQLYALMVDADSRADRAAKGPQVRLLGKHLLDPYAREVWFPPGSSRAAAAVRGTNAGRAPLGVLPSGWRPTASVLPVERRPAPHERVIYEVHVRGFTARPNSGVAPDRMGTFAGLADRVDHLVALGITSVELLPVHQYDPDEGNYWGYMTLGFFAPHRQYSSGPDPRGEFAEMVTRLHAHGIEVLLDVVYNHTTEGDANGPVYHLRALGDEDYYLRRADGSYDNSSGTGNALRTNRGPARRMVVDSLRLWRDELGVDGFRFDLVSLLSRSAHGHLIAAPASSPVLDDVTDAMAGTVLVAEAWDVAAYQLGSSFPARSWGQWNGRYRDDVRSFVRGDDGYVAAITQRLMGSPDMFPSALGYLPWQSINFVTAHDGFTMWDLVSYVHKRNGRNGHGGTDGTDDNRSSNWGWEGDAGVPASIVDIRKRQMKNFCALMMLSAGTPMFVAGDEFANTQLGNNNPYNRDDETTWLDWERAVTHADLVRFFSLMIRFRRAHPAIGHPSGWAERVTWRGVQAEPDLSHQSRSLAWFLSGAEVGDDDLFACINAWNQSLVFTMPDGPGAWLRVADTSLASPADIAEAGAEAAVTRFSYEVAGHSLVLFRRQATDGARR